MKIWLMVITHSMIIYIVLDKQPLEIIATSPLIPAVSKQFMITESFDASKISNKHWGIQSNGTSLSAYSNSSFKLKYGIFVSQATT